MTRAAQVTLVSLLMTIPCQALFGQNPTPSDPSSPVQSEPATQEPPAVQPSEPPAEDPLVSKLQEEKEKLIQEMGTLRDELAEVKANLRRSVSQKSTIQNTLSSLQQAEGDCRNKINAMRPTIVTKADVVRKTDSLLVWSILLDKAGPIYVELQEISQDDQPITRRRQTVSEWNKSHVLPFVDLNDHTQYSLVVYSNTTQSGSSAGETVIGDPKLIADLMSETKSVLPVGRLEFSPIKFLDRKALFTVTAKDAAVRATFRCAKYTAPDREILPLEPQSVSAWLADLPEVKEPNYVPASGILIQKDKQENLECPGEIEPGFLYQVQFEGVVEDSGRKLESTRNTAYRAPVTFDFDDQGFGLSFDPENLTVTWGATLPPEEATLVLLVDEAGKQRTDIVSTTKPDGKAMKLALSTKELLRKRIQDKKIDQPLVFEIAMKRNGDSKSRLFRVNYLVDGAGGLTDQQKEKLQKALESFASNKPPSGKITWQEVFKLGLPVVMSFL